MKQLTMEETAQWLMQCEDAYILIHQSPDGDCVGAGYALAEMLCQMGKRASVHCNDPIPNRYQFMLPEQQTQTEFAPQCIITVDVADPKLLGKLEGTLGKAVDLCIDHHNSNVEYAANRYLDGGASATCEILYALAKLLPVTITRHIAECLYTGIATDTGCFQYDNVSALTHHTAAALMECYPEGRYCWINRKMFAVKSFGRLKLEQLLIDHLESYLDGKCILICITQAFLQQFEVDEAELEGIAGFPLQVEGVEIGITMKEKEPGKFRISMRSADQVDVSAICQMLGGGGHLKASGCFLTGTADKVRKMLLDAAAKELEAYR